MAQQRVGEPRVHLDYRTRSGEICTLGRFADGWGRSRCEPCSAGTHGRLGEDATREEASVHSPVQCHPVSPFCSLGPPVGIVDARVSCFYQVHWATGSALVPRFGLSPFRRPSSLFALIHVKSYHVLEQLLHLGSTNGDQRPEPRKQREMTRTRNPSYEGCEGVPVRNKTEMPVFTNTLFCCDWLNWAAGVSRNYFSNPCRPKSSLLLVYLFISGCLCLLDLAWSRFL